MNCALVQLLSLESNQVGGSAVKIQTLSVNVFYKISVKMW
jgi:hypothetical protein